MEKSDCVIIGAGLSGLACAMTLKRQGLRPLILESQGHVGGRVQTTKTEDGFILDQGFQVLLNSYPELSHFVDIEKLNLKKFNSGALLYNGSKLELLANPIVHPETLVTGFFQNILTPKDKALTIKLIAMSQFSRSDSPVGEISTGDYLKNFGFSSEYIEMFWRPFLTGVFLDPELQTGSNYFRFLIRAFSLGEVSIPENGMQALPEQMAASIGSNSIRLNEPVRSWNVNEVVLKSGERIQVAQVICAFDSNSHLNDSRASSYRSVSTFYFSFDKIDTAKLNKWLILVPQSSGSSISHMSLVSSVSEKYGNGKCLLSVSVVGDKNPTVRDLKAEIEKVLGEDLNLHYVSVTRVEKALPIKIENGLGYGIKEGVIHCGDQWCSPSINGALKSGRLAAEYVSHKSKSNQTSSKVEI